MVSGHLRMPCKACIHQTGPSCSKLTTSLVSESLKFQNILFAKKNTTVFAEKLCGSFVSPVQKFLTCLQPKITHHTTFFVSIVRLNKSLLNDLVEDYLPHLFPGFRNKYLITKFR